MSVKDRSYLKVVTEKEKPEGGRSKAPAQNEGEIYPPPERFTEAEREVWRELWGRYSERITDEDRPAFEKLVKAEAEYRQADIEVGRLGQIIKAPGGGWAYSPFWVMRRKANEEFLKYQRELGLTPLSRGRAKQGKHRARRDNPFASLKSLGD